MSGLAQISPRVLSAFERLEKAVERLNKVCESQSDKVDASELDILQAQVKGLQDDNLALSEALEVHTQADYDAQFEQLNDKIIALSDQNRELAESNTSLKEMNSGFSQRLEKLIGNVQQVLQEEE
ncbi:hypothetical protein [Terasakiella sp. SH-1]|uniref:hypothetical protein n=1 Tax=Terasakiella sp. SH-1 TaxID=2560057 RepID=UPI0010742895|nr:hypothetical protein [Terasakiella sp. SH-1]